MTKNELLKKYYELNEKIKEYKKQQDELKETIKQLGSFSSKNYSEKATHYYCQIIKADTNMFTNILKDLVAIGNQNYKYRHCSFLFKGRRMALKELGKSCELSSKELELIKEDDNLLRQYILETDNYDIKLIAKFRDKALLKEFAGDKRQYSNKMLYESIVSALDRYTNSMDFLLG